MVIKVKEIMIGRSRKWAWDFGNSVGFNLSVTIEGTTAKDTVPDIIKTGLIEIGAMEIKETERCRNVYDIAQFKADEEFNSKVENPTLGDGIPEDARYPATDEKALPVLKEVNSNEELDLPALNSSLMRYNNDAKKWEIKGSIDAMTEKAFCIKVPGYKDGLWFPKSQCTMKQEQKGLIQWIQINTWLLQDKGLIGGES